MRMRLCLVALLALAGCVQPLTPDAGVQPSITTLAGGNGAPGGFLDGPFASARFAFPEGLALDAKKENLYVADSDNHVIRMLELASSRVTTVAGVGGQQGFADSSADGGARLRVPRNLVLAPNGKSLFFTDTGNLVIRRLDLETNVVTTEFGTPGAPGTDDGLAAKFGRMGFFALQPWGGGMVIDTNGVMYVADSANQTIRSIDLTTREVRTVAGRAGVEGSADGPATMATFNKPSGLGLAGGALYITEANNLTVRKLDLTTLTVSTVAGKAPANTKHFCEDISPVIPPECGSTDAPNGLDARFRFPFGMEPDGRGGFFIVDSHNNLIRRFDVATSAVTSVAGAQLTVIDDLPRPSLDTAPGQPGTFSHPSHAVFVPPKTLYVADRSANCIRRVELPVQ